MTVNMPNRYPSSCAKPGCRERIAAGMLACHAHWFALGGDLRGTINRSYRNGDQLAYRSALIQAFQEWRRVP